MFQRFHEVKASQEAEMMQTGGGSRSSTPGTVVDGRVMFTSHPSPLNSQSLGASYPSISSPSPSVSSGGSLGHSIFTGTKYLSSTPPEAHRYMSDTYRLTSSEPVDQSRYLVDPNRMSVDPYRQQTAESHRMSADLQRIRTEDQTIEPYHRSGEDIYQNNNPIDLQRIPNANSQQLINAQRLVSELQRIHADPQRIVDDLRSGMSSETLQRHEIQNNSNNNSGSPNAPSLNYRSVLNEPIRSPSEHPPPPQHPQRIMTDSMLRSHADPQRLVQESFRDYFSASQRQVIDNARAHSDVRLVSTENHRYIPAENLRSDTQRYAVNIPPERGMMAENLRLGNESSHNLVAENLRIGSETPHTMMPENLRIGEQHSMIPENLRVGAETPHSVMPENLRVGAETPHTMIPENLRVTPEASRMVPENLCLTEPSHQAMPENLHIGHDTVVNGRQSLPSSGDVTNSRMLNHSQPSADSPMPLMRSHYDPSPHKMIAEPSHPMRVQSPHYADTIYRNDIHTNMGPHAPPTPAPSVPPPMPEQVSTTPHPQYYSTYTHSTPAGHNNQYPAYMNEACEDTELRESGMSLEEKIERGYQDIKPFDQDYPVSMPMMHMSQDVLPPPPPLPKPPKPKKPKEPKPPRLPIVHKCHECLRVFKNSTQLKNHMWRHTGEKPFTCDECGSKFTQQGNLRAHRRIHTGERPYQCNECKACFTQLSTLKTHQKIHSDERPYKCNECDAAFRQVANLKTHQVTHTGERPHKCDQCDKAFTQKSNLKAHKNRVHYGEGISVPAKRGRKKNPVAIKPFSCLECGAKFTVLSNLKIHSKLHTGDKPFECDHCGAGFAQRSNLKTHIQRMHGRTPGQSKRRYKCDECPAMFRLRRCLKTHKKRRHPIKSLKIKILRESRYHLNSAVVEGGGEEEDKEEEDMDEGEEEADEEEDDDEEESEDREEPVDSKIALLNLPTKSADVDDVYESGFNSTDEESIGDYRSHDRGHRASMAEPIVQIREPKLERMDSPLPSERSSPSQVGQMEAKQEVFHDSPLALGESQGSAFQTDESRTRTSSTQNDVPRRQLLEEADDVYMERGEVERSLNCAGEGTENRSLRSQFESKNLSIESSDGS